MFFDVALGRLKIRKNRTLAGRGSPKLLRVVAGWSTSGGFEGAWVLGVASRTLHFEVKNGEKRIMRVV